MAIAINLTNLGVLRISVTVAALAVAAEEAGLMDGRNQSGEMIVFFPGKSEE